MSDDVRHISKLTVSLGHHAFIFVSCFESFDCSRRTFRPMKMHVLSPCGDSANQSSVVLDQPFKDRLIAIHYTTPSQTLTLLDL